MATRYWLKKTLGTSYPADPSDVLNTKRRLQSQGYYDEPEYGITEYPDTPMFEGIKRFQKDNGLRVDGLMRPKGPTETQLAARSPRYTCSRCGALHGGVFSPSLCHRCWVK
ncbi:peptidoglycan-binding protein [Marivibrio halodurans]|uniref:Peptidoglycan-binding protein n=1 Tax=Marivibrio halodurans TaxID=2039722 RepID=A0A8J7S2G3_9PROT|nr:peptidoglycan-binding domain-containing protein [Marivibrio halodurans]MBP5858655.1 peptidoglycan-binding protein [Marivibrio halodurans]